MTNPLFPSVNLALVSGVVSGQPHGLIHAGRHALALTLIIDHTTGVPSHPTALIVTGPLVEQLFEALSDGTPILCEGALSGASHADSAPAVILRVTRAQCGAPGGLIVEFNAMASKASVSKVATTEAPRVLGALPSRPVSDSPVLTEPTSDEEAPPIRRSSPRGRRGGRRHRGKYRAADMHTPTVASAETPGDPGHSVMRTMEESESPRPRRPARRPDRVTQSPLQDTSLSTVRPDSQITAGRKTTEQKNAERKIGPQPPSPQAPPAQPAQPAPPAPFGIAETEERFDPFFHNRK